MVGNSVDIYREGTKGFGTWEGAVATSFSYESVRSQRARLVSNESFSMDGIQTEGFGEEFAQEETIQSPEKYIPMGRDAINNVEKNQVLSKPARAFYRNKILNEAVDRLDKFSDSLDTAEAPMHINLAKRALANSWKYITEEDSGIRIAIASLEGALRQKKWRDYNSEQVITISDIIRDCINGRIDDIELALKRLSILHKKDIDIYPSASEDDYDEEEET